MAGIYVHIPFCRKACHYCDFHFSTTLNLVDQVVDTIVLEAEREKSFIKEPLHTIYLGGGTPSLLKVPQLEKIINALYKHYKVDEELEFTIEANPDDLDSEKVEFYKQAGINRMSIGTQSFSNEVLQFLNRSHSAQQTVTAVGLCVQNGINNFSLDLIYGIPNQTEKQCQEDIKAILALNPTHISSYALTIEPKTVFGNWSRKGKIAQVKEEVLEANYALMVEMFTASGYSHYEVSNFAKPGFISKHNAAYWQQVPYLGLGPGAHSFDGQATRRSNILSNPKYIQKIEANKVVYTTEILQTKELVTEYIFTKIRTFWGLDFTLMEKLYNYQLSKNQLNFIHKIVDNGLGSFTNNKLILNSKGYFVSDSVVIELIP